MRSLHIRKPDKASAGVIWGYALTEQSKTNAVRGSPSTKAVTFPLSSTRKDIQQSRANQPQAQRPTLALYLAPDTAVRVTVLRHLCILEVGQRCRYLCHWSNWTEIPFQRKQSLLGFWKGKNKTKLYALRWLLCFQTLTNFILEEQTFLSCVLLQAKLPKDLKGLLSCVGSWIKYKIEFYQATNN